MPEKSILVKDFNQRGTEFLKVELETGLTFANIALGEVLGSEERIKAQANARKAYQTVLRLRGRFDPPNEAATRDIENALDRLRSVLEKLGERLT